MIYSKLRHNCPHQLKLNACGQGQRTARPYGGNRLNPADQRDAEIAGLARPTFGANSLFSYSETAPNGAVLIVDDGLLQSVAGIRD